MIDGAVAFFKGGLDINQSHSFWVEAVTPIKMRQSTDPAQLTAHAVRNPGPVYCTGEKRPWRDDEI